MLEPGHIIDRYRVLRVLGQGGMAVVYAAQHVELGSFHAIKVLMITTQHLRDRALQEGRIQATLNHPNIVAVSDVVRIDGAPALVMELVRGPSLEGYLDCVRPSFEQIDALTRGIIDGLELAHQKGRVHRDLKPANVLIAVDNGAVVAKLADFGLAKILSGDALSHSRTGMTMGTPAYMAPEQFKDAKNVDERADIFSLGVVLYELCTGAMPYAGGDMITLYKAIEAGEYVPPTRRVPELPRRMELAISKALHADPEHRHQSVAELREVWCDGRPVPHKPWTTEQSAELLRMGPKLPEPTALNAASLRSATHSEEQDSQPAGGSPQAPGGQGSETLMPDSFAHPAEEDVGYQTQGLEPSPVKELGGFSAYDAPAPAPPPQEEPRQRPLGPVLLAVFGTVLILGIGLWIWQGQQGAPAESAGLRQAAPPEQSETQPLAEVASTPPAVVAPVVEPVREPIVEPTRVTIPASPPEEPPAKEPVVEEPPPKPKAQPVVAGTSLRLRGVDRGYVVDAQGKQHGLGVMNPGKYKVYAFFDASKATQVLEVDLKDGQEMSVNCDVGMRMCRAN
jgi:serine/threonine-protein kinase